MRVQCQSLCGSEVTRKIKQLEVEEGARDPVNVSQSLYRSQLILTLVGTGGCLYLGNGCLSAASDERLSTVETFCGGL